MSISASSYGKTVHYSKSEKINHSEHLNINGIDGRRDCLIFLEMVSVDTDSYKTGIKHHRENAGSFDIFLEVLFT